MVHLPLSVSNTLMPTKQCKITTASRVRLERSALDRTTEINRVVQPLLLIQYVDVMVGIFFNSDYIHHRMAHCTGQDNFPTS